MEVEENAWQLAVHYWLQVQLDAALEVVESVDQGTDVPPQGPASSGLLDQPNKVVKGISLDQFADVDRVAVVNE